MISTRAGYRRRQLHRSTLAGLGGIVVVAVAVVLSLSHAVGIVVPTVLAIAGAGTLLAGVVAGAVLVAENFRYNRDASFYDPDEEEDDDFHYRLDALHPEADEDDKS